MRDDVIAKFENVTVNYHMKKFSLKAVNNISLELKKGKITALVGESGSGKSTLAVTLLNALVEPGVIESGRVLYQGEKEIIVNELKGEELRLFRFKEISMVFQGAQSSLNPINTIFRSIEETLKAHMSNVNKKMVELEAERVLSLVNLDAKRILPMYPHELSGGMKQRVMIAFSLLLNPKIVILDEPTTALDVITQDYIFSILKKINQELGITMLLLTHDMGIVAKYSDYLGVMYAGKMMEYGTTIDVFEKRYHPYTYQLIKATPSLLLPPEAIESIKGNPPNMLDLPQGCPFAPRCEKVKEVCIHEDVKPSMIENDHICCCHLYRGDEYE